MSGKRRLLSRLATGLVLVAVMAAVGAAVVVRVADLRVQAVLSGSMRPTVAPGDVAVTAPVPISELAVGDVIVFDPPGETAAVIHRITSIHDGVVTTRGDANSVDDPWRVRLAGSTAYRLVAVVPLLGWLAGLSRPAFLLAGLLAGLAIVLELRKGVAARIERRRLQSPS